MNIIALLLAIVAALVFFIEAARTYRSRALHWVALGLGLLTVAWIVQSILDAHQYHIG